MQSLVKCASCGKKPGVKSNVDRAAWGGSKPARDDSRGPMDADLGAFVSGLRESGAKLSNHAAKEASAGEARELRGPERFFYDKNSYTGTHANGGPEHVKKGNGTSNDQSWKRPSSPDVDSSEIVVRPAARRTHSFSGSGLGIGGRPATPVIQVTTPAGNGMVLFNSGSRPVTPAGNSRQGSKETPVRSSSSSCARTLLNSKDARKEEDRPQRLTGPERFFYDKSTYTGCHLRGGPSSVAKGGGTSFDQSWKRPT